MRRGEYVIYIIFFHEEQTIVILTRRALLASQEGSGLEELEMTERRKNNKLVIVEILCRDLSTKGSNFDSKSPEIGQSTI